MIPDFSVQHDEFHLHTSGQVASDTLHSIYVAFACIRMFNEEKLTDLKSLICMSHGRAWKIVFSILSIFFEDVATLTLCGETYLFVQRSIEAN